MFQIRKNQEGLTLIELIIALGVFSLAVFIAVSLFLSSLKAQKKILAIQSSLDNLKYVMEMLTKEARMAKTDLGSCGQANYIYFVSPINNELSFVSSQDECVKYILSAEGRLIKQISRGGETLGEMPITSEEVIIDQIKFISPEMELENPATSQPKLTISINFYPKNIPSATVVHMQTTISSRAYE